MNAEVLPCDTLAAIDLGSNSFHMIVARHDGSHFEIVDRLKETVRLAAGLDDDSNITDDAMQRAITCLERFGERIRELPPECVRAVGTNTLRKAHNSNIFLPAAQKALGHLIETIAGREEARLIYLGVAHSLAGDDSRRLVVDIGGGSTELIVGDGFDSLHRESLHMGCVSFSQQFFADGRINTKRLNEAEEQAHLELQPIRRLYEALGWKAAMGASGTIKAVAKVCGEMGYSEHGITLDGLQRIKEDLLAAGHIDQINLKGLSTERLPVFIGGFVVLKAVFERLGIERMTVSDGALREGLLHDLLGRLRHDDVRDQTVNIRARRHGVDEDHAHHVAKTASLLLGQCAHSWALSSDDCPHYLDWAARLHEVGLSISHTQYHKHGSYILENADMQGFSRQEQQILAALVRGHRRKFPSKIFRGLPESLQTSITRLTVLLRLAVLLHRNRSQEARPDIRIDASGDQVSLMFPTDWLDKHPLTRLDLAQEAEFLAAADIRLVF